MLCRTSLCARISYGTPIMRNFATHKISFGVLFLVSVTAVRSCPAQVIWKKMAPATSPSLMLTPAMAYDSARGVTVLFGNGETWEWNGLDWKKLKPTTSPPNRSGHSMVYDSCCRRVVLFGGAYSAVTFADTWEWDGANWLDRTPKTGNPPARYDHSMAFDSGRGRVVLYGGVNKAYLSDTWEWNGLGRTWTKRTPATAPNATHGHAMAYDSARQRVVLFGGWGPLPVDETWEWDGCAGTWIERVPKRFTPFARHDPVMAYDSERERVVLFWGCGTRPIPNA
jgi:hypothetical protein